MSKSLLRVLLENTTDGDGAHAETTHGGGGDPDNEEILGGHSGIADVVFVVTGMLFIGIMTRSLLQRVPIPYTVWLLVSLRAPRMVLCPPPSAGLLPLCCGLSS